MPSLRPPRRFDTCAVALERCVARRGWYSPANVLFPATHLGALLTRGVRSRGAKKRLTTAPCGKTPKKGRRMCKSSLSLSTRRVNPNTKKTPVQLTGAERPVARAERRQQQNNLDHTASCGGSSGASSGGTIALRLILATSSADRLPTHTPSVL